MQLRILKASTESEIETAFASLDQLHAGALLVAGDPLFSTQREQLVALASRHAVPAIYDTYIRRGRRPNQLWIEPHSRYRQLGFYAGKILKGAKPADLPGPDRRPSSWSSISTPPRRSA